MDRVDVVILAVLAWLALSFPLHLRWNRGRASRIDLRTMRSLRLALRRRTLY